MSKTHIQGVTALPGPSLSTPMLSVLCLQPFLHRKHQPAQDACMPRLASLWRTRYKASPDSRLCHFCSQDSAQPESLCAPHSAKLSTHPDQSRCPPVSSRCITAYHLQQAWTCDTVPAKWKLFESRHQVHSAGAARLAEGTDTGTVAFG